MEPVKPFLKNPEAFRQALEHYEVSERAQSVLANICLVAVSGLAGGGRNTVISQLVARYNYAFIVSDTTRPPKLRDGALEQNGVQYYFRSEEAVLNDIQHGEFLEAEVIHDQQVSGVSIRELERLSASSQNEGVDEQGSGATKTLINDFEYGGIANVVRAKPDTFAIALLPPSYEEWIARLSKREVMSDEEFQNRMRTAKVVLESMLDRLYLKFVVNDDVEPCAERIDAIVHRGVYTDEMHQAGRALARDILRQVSRYETTTAPE